jgi:hypothetical protein
MKHPLLPKKTLNREKMDVLSVIIPTPEKKMFTKKYRRRQET